MRCLVITALLLLLAACQVQEIGHSGEGVTIRYEAMHAGEVEALTRANAYCARGGLVAYPTETTEEGLPGVGMRYATFRCVPPTG